MTNPIRQDRLDAIDLSGTVDEKPDGSLVKSRPLSEIERARLRFHRAKEAEWRVHREAEIAKRWVYDLEHPPIEQARAALERLEARIATHDREKFPAVYEALCTDARLLREQIEPKAPQTTVTPDLVRMPAPLGMDENAFHDLVMGTRDEAKAMQLQHLKTLELIEDDTVTEFTSREAGKVRIAMFDSGETAQETEETVDEAEAPKMRAATKE